MEDELFDENLKPEYKDDIDLEVEEVKNTILKINQCKIDKDRNYDHEKSPEWPEIAKMMSDEITH